MEPKISVPQLGLTFAGCFLGVGYVSGKELWKFFGQYGILGYLGLLLSLAGLGIFGILVLRLACHTGKSSIRELVIPWDAPVLSSAVSVFSVTILLCVVVIMTAGAGAIFQQLFDFPTWLCSLVFSLLIAFLAVFGLTGMLSLFSCVVPILIITTLFFSLLSLVYLPQETVPQNVDHGWFLSSIIFCAYNVFTSIAILAPLGQSVGTPCVFKGVSLGTGLLLLIATPILCALNHCAPQTRTDLPMLAIVSRMWFGFGLAYAVLLLLAMLITALSCFLTGANELMSVHSSIGVHKNICFLVLAVCIWLASLVGFGSLIDLIYPLFGTISSLCLVCLIFHYRKEMRRHPSNTKSV